MPAYASSDGSHATYSTTAAIYHQPNCHCHLVPCQPPHCISPAHQSVQSADSTNTSASSNSSNPMAASCTKQVWITKERTEAPTNVNRLNQPIAWIWSLVSILLFALCTLSLTQNSWLVNGRTKESLGIIYQCKTNPGSHRIECNQYDGLSALQLPSVSWKLTLIFFCLADTLLGLSCLLALGTSLLSTAKTRRHISFFTGYVQLFAGKFHTNPFNILG